MPESTVEVRDLVKRYNSRIVLDGISFCAKRGDFIVVFGRSGCGKTTLLNIIGGLDRPTSGDVAIEGRSIVGLPEDELARLRLNKIGFVFQDYNLLPELTIRENILVPQQLAQKRDEARVDHLMAEFEIKHIANERPNSISGGEAQRTAVARALVNSPSILLADEPTGNLDYENAETVMSTFELARKDFGATVVMATHDRDTAPAAARVVNLPENNAFRA